MVPRVSAGSSAGDEKRSIIQADHSESRRRLRAGASDPSVEDDPPKEDLLNVSAQLGEGSLI